MAKTLSQIIGTLAVGAALAYGTGELSAQIEQDQLLGRWMLVSIYEEDAGGEELDHWGSSAEGEFTAEANGQFSLVLASLHVVRIVRTQAERACHAVKTCRDMMDQRVLSYAGRFSINSDGAVTFEINSALEHGWAGTTVTTSARLDGDTLHFVTASNPSPTGSFYVHLVWRKRQ